MTPAVQDALRNSDVPMEILLLSEMLNKMGDDQRIDGWWGVRVRNLEIRFSPVELWIEVGEHFNNQSFVVAQNPTAGDVRRLCEGLGIQLIK